MQLADKVIVVTGGANGIGQALCTRFAAEGARGVVVADIDGDLAQGCSWVRRAGGSHQRPRRNRPRATG